MKLSLLLSINIDEKLREYEIISSLIELTGI